MTIKDGAWPESIKDQGVIDLLKTYMNLSNATNPSHPDEADEEKFAALFTPDGVYELGSKSAKGHDDIVKMREALFAFIPERTHWIEKLYVAGGDEHNLMAHGKVEYKHHHGHETATDWAARYVLEKDEKGETKFKVLQIIIDTAAHN